MFRVVWLQEALDDLAAVWVEAASALREAITTATSALDQELAADPYRNSESREDGTRILFAYPLALQIEVDPAQRVVWVLHAWRFRRRGE